MRNFFKKNDLHPINRGLLLIFVVSGCKLSSANSSAVESSDALDGSFRRQKQEHGDTIMTSDYETYDPERRNSRDPEDRNSVSATPKLGQQCREKPSVSDIEEGACDWSFSRTKFSCPAGLPMIHPYTEKSPSGSYIVKATCGKTRLDRVGYYWVDPSWNKRKTQVDDIIACGDDAFLAGVSMVRNRGVRTVDGVKTILCARFDQEKVKMEVDKCEWVEAAGKSGKCDGLVRRISVGIRDRDENTPKYCSNDDRPNDGADWCKPIVDYECCPYSVKTL